NVVVEKDAPEAALEQSELAGAIQRVRAQTVSFATNRKDALVVEVVDQRGDGVRRYLHVVVQQEDDFMTRFGEATIDSAQEADIFWQRHQPQPRRLGKSRGQPAARVIGAGVVNDQQFNRRTVPLAVLGECRQDRGQEFRKQLAAIP